MKYDKILFDLDNTLLDFCDAEINAHKLATLKYQIEYRLEDYKVYHDINDALWKEHELGKYTRAEITYLRFKKYLDYLGVTGVDPAEFNKSYVSNLALGKKMMDGALETLKAVKELDAKAYIITNGVTFVQENRLNGHPIMQYIDGICISEAAGAPKPNKEFFIKASEIFGVEFDDKTLVVGDSLSSDIKGGINAGINTCWVNKSGKPHPSDITPTYEIDDITKLIDIVK